MLKPFKVDGMEWTRRTALQAALACAAVGPALAEPAPRATSRLILLGTGGGPTPKAGRSAPAQVILVGGDADVIDTIFWSSDRARTMDFTAPFADVREPIYALAHLTVDSDETPHGVTVQSVLDALTTHLNAEPSQ